MFHNTRMDYEHTNLEINRFINNYFKEANKVIEYHQLMIDDNELFRSKVDYYYLKPYIVSVIKLFSTKDASLLKGIIAKLYHDVEALSEYKESLLDKEGGVKSTFVNKFLYQTPNYKEFRQKFDAAKKAKKLNLVKLYKGKIDDLYMIYKDHFVQHFSRESSYVTETLRKIINVKLYYINKILWLHVKDSEILHKYFDSLEVHFDFNLKSYIEYQLQHFHTIQDETLSMEYLKECLVKIGEENE